MQCKIPGTKNEKAFITKQNCLLSYGLKHHRHFTHPKLLTRTQYRFFGWHNYFLKRLAKAGIFLQTVNACVSVATQILSL